MGNAKIAAGDVLKFLGRRTYPEKYPFAAASTNKFSLPTLPRFLMSRWNSHVRLLPDYRVFRVTVRSTEIYKNCMFQLSTFLGNFSSKNLEFAIFKIFLIATWNSHGECYVFLVYQMGAPLFRIAATFVDEFSRLHWYRGYLRDYWEFHKGF
jgi:hypothetical protein